MNEGWLFTPPVLFLEHIQVSFPVFTCLCASEYNIDRLIRLKVPHESINIVSLVIDHLHQFKTFSVVVVIKVVVLYFLFVAISG